MYKIYKEIGSDLLDLTDFVGKITRRSSIDEISEELEFEIGRDETILGVNYINEGNTIIFENDGKVIFRGIIVDKSTQGREKQTFKCFDYGWYLNKSEEIYQFNNSVSNNIIKILNDFKIPIGSIVNIPTNYKNIVRGNLKEIMSKMLDLAQKEQGEKYLWEIRSGEFYLEKLNENVVIYNSKLFNNVDITEIVSNPTHKKSINGMYNAVKVAEQEDNSINVLAFADDLKSQDIYGRLQKLEYLSKDDKPKAQNIAVNQLETLNRVQHNANVTLLGNDDCKANRIIQIDEPITDIVGKFLIKQCTHNYSATRHTIDLELEVL